MSVQVSIDTGNTAKYIADALGSLSSKTPTILKNSLNATARKVRKQIIKDAQGRYALRDKSVLKSDTAAKLYEARVSNLLAEIKSTGPMLELMDFMADPNGARGKVLKGSGMKALEIGNLKAFVTQFSNGHIAVVQRRGPDRLPLKKLLSPAVPHMLGNTEVAENARSLVEEVLAAEIGKRITQTLEKAARTT